jgi:MFS family permease
VASLGARSAAASVGRALRHRNYRLFFFGQGISLIGTWVTRIAMSWLVYRLTNSSLLLGLTGFAGQLPTFLLAPFAGVIVDRSDRYRLLLVTQVLSMLQSGLLAYYALRGTITVWHVLFLAIFQGLINAFDTPARQAFLVDMVDTREDLPNAIALNSSLVNVARLVGPSVAGVLISVVGEGVCFTVDALSYVAVLGALAGMRIVARERPVKQAQFATELREGFAYVAGFAPIRDLLLLLAVVSLAGMPYAVLMPVFATQVFHGGPHTLGWLMTTTGVGALLAALWLATRPSVLGLGRVVTASGLVFGLSLLGFSYARELWLGLPLLVLVGGGMMMQMAATNTLIQTLVDERMRGRVMSFYTMAFFGMTPFGSLLAGFVASHFSAALAVRSGGVVTVFAVLLFLRRLPALRQQMRPSYERLGILPPSAAGGPSPNAELSEPAAR